MQLLLVGQSSFIRSPLHSSSLVDELLYEGSSDLVKHFFLVCVTVVLLILLFLLLIFEYSLGSLPFLCCFVVILRIYYTQLT